MAELSTLSKRSVPGFRARFRGGLRHAVLSLRAATYTQPGGPFIRCLYAHHVFDDERRAFERHIGALKGMGEFIGTADAVDLIEGQVPLDGRYFHLSYDDGLGCLLRNAAPILSEAAVPAIVFVNSAMAGQAGPELRSGWYEATNYADDISVLDWEGLRQLKSAGFEIGAHTQTHARLSDISADPDRLARELGQCKSEIEAALGAPCPYFAWPYGTMADIDRMSIAAIRNAGYRAAFGVYRMTVTPGHTNPFLIPRHHFEPYWPEAHVTYFAQGGMEAPTALPDW